jgi:hypothetical protein
MWVEQGYKQVKGELGWADFQVRSARAISRHLVLVCCAFSFCWHATHATPDTQPVESAAAADPPPAAPARPAAATAARGASGSPPSALEARRNVAAGAAAGARLADPLARAWALVASMVAQPAAPSHPGPADLGHRGQAAAPLHTTLN